MRKPPLYIGQLLAWADEHLVTTGHWPDRNSGRIEGTDEKWGNIEQALHKGYRGLPKGLTLARLLRLYRGRRNRKALPPLTIGDILSWADAHQARTGQWPKQRSGAVSDAPGETWIAVEDALLQGIRGLPGGSSLARLLDEHRGLRNYKDLSPLTAEQILAWADAHRDRTRRWPTRGDGTVLDAPGETWTAVEVALSHGRRGMPGGSSLAKLLSECRGMRTRSTLPRLTIERVLELADAHHRRTGKWPTLCSGQVAEMLGDTWGVIDKEMRRGGRGLVSRTSLAVLLFQHRAVAPRGPSHLCGTRTPHD